MTPCFFSTTSGLSPSVLYCDQCLQKIGSILEKLWANLAFYLNELKAEIQARENFKEQLQAQITSQPSNFSGLDSILSQEQARRSAVEQSLKRPIQVWFYII